MEDNKRTSLNDPILRLAEYWLTADLLHNHLHEIRENTPNIKDAIKSHGFMAYLNLWLSTLYIVSEGFIQLKIEDDILEPLTNQHIDSLRIFRNATFHFQLKPDKHVQFLSENPGRLNWAEDLHAEFASFFGSYLHSIGAFNES